MMNEKNNNILNRLIDNVVNRQEVVSASGNLIEAPPYSAGSFDEYGMPLQEKVKYMYRKVLGKAITVLIVEGGTRGGKDVFSLNLWSKVLMTSKERMHLALGVSLEHAINTIYDSNGFGIKYLIPHGKFMRDTESGAGNRGVFKFFNVYGEEREVHFYGNLKRDDHKKFQGYTFGSVYINEGILQHINGINEARQRIATSKDALMIITQNPVGTSHVLYTDFENGYMFNEEEKRFIEKIKKDKTVRNKFLLFKKQQEKLEKQMINRYTREKLLSLGKTKLEELTDLELQDIERDKSLIQSELRYGSEEINEDGSRTVIHGLYSKPINDFVEIPKKLLDNDTKLDNASMYKILAYDRGLENPNNIENGYDMAYMHFTMWDNIGMTEMQINDRIKGYDRSSALFKQRILGERVSSDGLLFPEFSDYNILTNEIEFYETNPNTLRVIAIDPGFNHPTAIVDAEVDLYNGMVYVLGENKIDLSEIDFKSRNETKIEEGLWEVIRARKGRKLPDMLIFDPSNPSLISYFGNRGFNVVPADNSTQSAKSKDLAKGDKTVKKGTKGIDLIKLGLMKLKFMFHYSCVETIKEVRGMSVVFNENTGNDDIIKINDDMFDAFKYIVNTTGINPEIWEQSEVLDEYEKEKEQLLQNEKREEKEGNLGGRERIQAKIRRARNDFARTRSYRRREHREWWE